MSNKESNNKKKREYQKPELRTIELAAEEVLAIGCKLLQKGVTAVLNISRCRQPRRCNLVGS